MAKETKIALVTGAARRIGREIALDLASHGFSVVVHVNRSTDEGVALASAITAAGGRAALIEGDLTDLDRVRGILSAASAHFGPPDLLVNNASLFDSDSLMDHDDSVWDRHFALHVRAPVELARDFARQLAPSREGLIVNMIDQRVLKPNPNFFSYSLSKSALWAATQTMAQALAPRIRVNAIGPGPSMPSARQDLEDFARQTAGLLLGRGPEPAEFGATIRYLWECRSITGQMIALDGGQHLAWRTPDIDGVPE